MATPRKQFNYNTPYAKPVQQQYPSQSEDYISFDMGGRTTQTNNAAAGPSSNEKTPGRYNPKYYQQNYRNSNSKANRRNLFNNNYGQQNNRQNYNQNYNQQQRYGPRNGNERPQFQQKNNHQKVKNDTPIASYCHPSMTEDPWFHLMQRIRSLDNSKISIKEISSPKDTTTPPPPDTSSNSETDTEEVDSVASD